MMRTRSGKTLSELVVMVAVLFGLTVTLGYAVQKVHAAAAHQTEARTAQAALSSR